GGPHVYTLRALLEADLYFATVIHAVRNCLRGNDPGIRAGEIEAGAAVPGLHARTEGPAFPQVDGALGGLPGVRCCDPLSDVGGGTTLVYVPEKSKPPLPSLASMRERKVPPSRRSTVLSVVCQSSDAAFHCLMSAGLLCASQTCCSGAFTMVSTVIFISHSPGIGWSSLVTNEPPPDRHGRSAVSRDWVRQRRLLLSRSAAMSHLPNASCRSARTNLPASIPSGRSA